MGVTNKGIYLIGKRLHDDTTLYPFEATFATGSEEFSGTLSTFTDPIVSKDVRWKTDGIYAAYETNLTTSEATGSNINSMGLTDQDSNLWFYNESLIGGKNDNFSVQVEGLVYMRRPR